MLPRIPADKSNCLYMLLDDARSVLKQYIKHYKSKVKSIKGSGLKKIKRGGNAVFFNDPKQLLKKLELIVGEILTGNTSIQMRRNTGL